jgi:hypothetical protein
MITLSGLTPKQQAFCDIMWNIDTKEGVDAFIKTLPLVDAKECQSLIQLMIMEFADTVTDFNEAKSILKQFRL